MGRAGENQAWTDGLRGAEGQHEDTTARLQQLLLGTARSEFERRWPGLRPARQPAQPPAGPDLDGLAREAAAGAFAAIMANLGDHDGQASFTVWARKFAVAEVAAKVARQLWRAGSLPAPGAWEQELPAVLGLQPDAEASWGGLLTSLVAAVRDGLSMQQRAVFEAAIVGRTPTDVLALEHGCSRSAIYKSLFEARRQLRDRLAADGYGPGPLARGEAAWPGLTGLLDVTQGDPGCDIAFQKLDAYVDSELQGRDPRQQLAVVSVHLRGCEACEQDYQGLLAVSSAGAQPHADR